MLLQSQKNHQFNSVKVSKNKSLLSLVFLPLWNLIYLGLAAPPLSLSESRKFSVRHFVFALHLPRFEVWKCRFHAPVPLGLMEINESSLFKVLTIFHLF